jgi:hypothetical protein
MSLPNSRAIVNWNGGLLIAPSAARGEHAQCVFRVVGP